MGGVERSAAHGPLDNHRSFGQTSDDAVTGQESGASAASTGVNQLIRLGQASAVINAQDVIADVMTHAAVTARDGTEQLDESFVPELVRSPQGQAPSSIAPASVPRR